jgi:hypothetical protein
LFWWLEGMRLLLVLAISVSAQTVAPAGGKLVALGSVVLPSGDVPSGSCPKLIVAVKGARIKDDIQIGIEKEQQALAKQLAGIRLLEFAAKDELVFIYCNATAADIRMPAITLRWTLWRQP